MKKLFTVLIAIMMIGALTSCGGDTGGDVQNGAPDANPAQNGAPEEEGGMPEDATNQQESPKTTIIMGTNPEFAPFEFMDENGIVGDFDGVDVALAKEFAEEQGLELQIDSMEFGSLISALQTGKVDFVAAGMTIKPERLAAVDFTFEYYDAYQYIIVRIDDEEIKGAADLNGKKIGVQEATTGDYVVSDMFENESVDNIYRYKRGVDGISALVKGDIDAIVIDSEPAKKFVINNQDAVKLVIDNESFENEQYAFAVQKGNTELLEQLNDFLSRKVEDGTIVELVKKYSE